MARLSSPKRLTSTPPLIISYPSTLRLLGHPKSFSLAILWVVWSLYRFSPLRHLRPGYQQWSPCHLPILFLQHDLTEESKTSMAKSIAVSIPQMATIHHPSSPFVEAPQTRSSQAKHASYHHLRKNTQSGLCTEKQYSLRRWREFGPGWVTTRWFGVTRSVRR